jgi:predicted dehydrogenase
MQDRLRVAIISAGRMASTIDDEIIEQPHWPTLRSHLPYSHAATYSQVPDVEMVAVCDLDEAKCKTFRERWGVARCYADYREMVAQEKPDILSIATSGVTHAEMTVFACEHGVRGIYCEKPMCCSLEEADRMVEAVQKHGVKYSTGSMRRHHPLFRKARQIVESGELGQLIGVTSWDSCALLHTHSHTADTNLFLSGEEPAVWVFGVLDSVLSVDHVESRRVGPDAGYDPQTHRWDSDPGLHSYTARTSSGVFLTHLPAVTDIRFEAVCSEGYLRVLDNTDSLEVYKRSKTRGIYCFDKLEIPPVPKGSGNLELVKDLVRAIKTDTQTRGNEVTTRNSMEILMGAAQSHLDGGRSVELPLANRTMYVPGY